MTSISGYRSRNDAGLERFSLHGKVAVVTGASSGLGVAYALALARAGADVVLGARRGDKLADTAEQVRKYNPRVVAVETDVTQVDQCDRLVEAAVEAFGRVDVLVNNAGTGGEYHPVTEDPPDHFRSVVDVNVHGSYWMIQPGSTDWYERVRVS